MNLFEEVIKDTKIINGDIPFLLRNDGQIFKCDSPVHPYLTIWTNDAGMSQETIQKDCYMEIHNNFPNVRELLRCSNNNTSIKLANDFIENSTVYSIAKNLQIFYQLTISFNEEFIRGRVGGEYWNNGELSVYLRISSASFDWTKVIRDFCFDNDRNFNSITVERDEQSICSNKVFTLGNVKCQNISLQEFENLSKDNLLENYINNTLNYVNVLEGNVFVREYRNLYRKYTDTFFT